MATPWLSRNSYKIKQKSFKVVDILTINGNTETLVFSLDRISNDEKSCRLHVSHMDAEHASREN